MSALKLDERPPLVVIVGDFNHAIFSPQWVARHLHGFPEGSEVPMLEMVLEVPGGVGQLTFIRGVAVAVSANRLEAFVLSQESERLRALEEVLANMVAVLPHTPLRGIGCNLQYIEEDPSTLLMDLFNTPEGIEGEYSLNSTNLTVQMDLDSSILNLSRVKIGNVVQFNFNYHYAKSDPDTYAELIHGMVERCRDHSAQLLASLYDLRDPEAVSFMPIATEESGLE